MDSRSRFLATMNFKLGHRVPLWEFGYWGSTVRRWYEEGLPRQTGIPDTVPDGQAVRGEATPWGPGRARDRDVHHRFGFDEGIRRIPVNNLLCPAFKEEILEDHGDWVLRRDEEGVLRKERKDRASLPEFVGWPVSNREDWERVKAERLRPTLEGRLPDNWSELIAEFRSRDYPLCIGGGFAGFFGTPRSLMGVEKLWYSFYDDPDLIQEIINHLADFWIAIYDRVLDQTDADSALIWEDMCYKAGPMVSPALFRKFMLPAYKRLVSFLKDRGVAVITVDTDGKCWDLIPLFIEAGVTGLYPFEVNAGMNVVEVRKAFPRLQMMGGIDKTKIAAGREAIDAELESKVPFMLELGGYIPTVDHNVSPDIPWENFVYYRERLEMMIQQATHKR